VGKAPAPDLHRVSGSLDEMARALTILGDTDSHDVRRAKALALLADPEAALAVVRRANEVLDASTDEATWVGPHDGTAPRRAADLGTAILYVHLSDTSLANPDQPGGGVARVEDLGPVLLDQVRDWLGHRNVVVKPVINIPEIRPVDCYEVPARMSEAIRLRNPASPFPFSPNTGRTGDDDHTRAYRPMDDGGPPGQTTVPNLGRMPRFEHRVKTFAGWKVTQPRSGIWIWRTPHGHYHLVDHASTTPLGKLH
jgi:hypothetical protein